MCIIIAKPAGTTLTESTLRHCFDSNPDGWGIMFASHDKVEVRKKVSSFNDFLSEYKALSERRLFIHFRWRTHGDKSDENCHPFDVGAGVHLMHNGIINVPQINDHESDTAAFAGIMRPYVEKAPTLPLTPETWKSGDLQSIARNNRLVFLNGQGRSLLIGNWVKEGNVHYSNTGFKGYRYTAADYASFAEDDGWKPGYVWSNKDQKWVPKADPTTTAISLPAPAKTVYPQHTARTTAPVKTTGVNDWDCPLPIYPHGGWKLSDMEGLTESQVRKVVRQYPYAAANIVLSLLGKDTCKLAGAVDPNEDGDENA